MSQAGVSNIQDAGGGDVIGPASSTTNDVAVYADTTGKVIKDSGLLYTNIVTGPASSTSGDIATFNGATGKIIQDSGVSITNISNAGLAVFGDGSDGSQTFDGLTVILGITPSNSTYTLARDLFLSSSTINMGVSIITAGYRIFCQGTLTNNGTIQWNGNAGALSVAGAILLNSNGSITTTGGTAGGAGNTGGGSNGATVSLGGYGGSGGNGGAGGSGGGNGATLSTPTVIASPLRAVPFILQGILFKTSDVLTLVQGAAGGGGGGGDGANKGGGGGGGAGILILSVLYFAGTGNIQAIGGNGGDGAVGGTNCGSGGGGGGGVINIVSRSIVSGAISGQTLSVAGGSPGNPTGTGSSGQTGGLGAEILLPN